MFTLLAFISTSGVDAQHAGTIRLGEFHFMLKPLGS